MRNKKYQPLEQWHYERYNEIEPTNSLKYSEIERLVVKDAFYQLRQWYELEHNKKELDRSKLPSIPETTLVKVVETVLADADKIAKENKFDDLKKDFDRMLRYAFTAEDFLRDLKKIGWDRVSKHPDWYGVEKTVSLLESYFLLKEIVENKGNMPINIRIEYDKS